MTKVEIIHFGDEDRPQFPECPRATLDSIIGHWMNGTPIVMCEIHGVNHTCEWRHKKDMGNESCPYGTVF